MSNVNSNVAHAWSSFLSTASESTSSSTEAHAASAFPLMGGFGSMMGPSMGMGMGTGMPMGMGAGMPMGMGAGMPMGMGAPMGSPMGMPMNSPMGAAGMPGAVQQPGMPGQFPQGMPGAGMMGRPGLPMSQPPQKPTFQKMYVQTTGVEQLATTVSTTHITFLWTMLALVSGALLTTSCFFIARKSKKGSEDGDSDGDSDSSDSESD